MSNYIEKLFSSSELLVIADPSARKLFYQLLSTQALQSCPLIARSGTHFGCQAAVGEAIPSRPVAPATCISRQHPQASQGVAREFSCSFLCFAFPCHEHSICVSAFYQAHFWELNMVDLYERILKIHIKQKQNEAIKPFVEFDSVDENIIRLKDNPFCTSVFMKFGKNTLEEKEKLGQ